MVAGMENFKERDDLFYLCEEIALLAKGTFRNFSL